ncbi:regulatory protein RecX [Psychrobacter sp. 1U2]|uniref:regulatory protein RecX n=1 Tax=Psychrobacter sp. 1U2 TaxID=3453577 RepID=UPI003F457DD0
MQIKTLAEILAESESDSASSAASSKPKRHNNNKSSTTRKTELFNRRKTKKTQRTKLQSSEPFSESKSNIASIEDIDAELYADDLSNTQPLTQPLSKHSKAKSTKRKKRKKRFHAAATFVAEPSDTPVYVAPETQTIQQMLAEVKGSIHKEGSQANNEHSSDASKSNNYVEDLTTSDIDNLPSALKAYLRTPEQKQAELDAIKAESRLRWLAFYYLSRREYGKAELKQKLIDKEQDPDSIDKLLDEFSDKGYQSDYRTTLMLIRENIRKGRGRQRIKQEFYKKKIAMPSNIDELIDMANSESEEFREFVDNDDSLVEGVDWLKLAVEARTRKYGDTVPVQQKEKAKQLRFLQYRGFKTDICFQALNYTLDTLDERF